MYDSPVARYLMVRANFYPTLIGALQLVACLDRRGSSLVFIILKNSGVILMKLVNLGMSVAYSSTVMLWYAHLSSLCSSHGLTHMLCLLLGLCLAGGGGGGAGGGGCCGQRRNSKYIIICN